VGGVWKLGSLVLVALVAGTLPARAADRPAVCAPSVIQQFLLDHGKLTPDGISFGEGVDLVRCGDVTADDHTDAVFTVASGGTAGDTRFGVLRGDADGQPGKLVLYKQGYKVGIARHNRRSFDTLMPHYRADDPNCCPSSFRQRRYTWTGSRFKAARHQKKLAHAPRRFYKP
jgi:hypothetical protein